MDPISRLLFPPKCILCRKLLSSQETDLCHSCRENSPFYKQKNFKLSFIAQWTAVWYYKDDVRSSLLRFKFYNARSYARPYGRLLGMKLQTQQMDTPDLLTWVPTGFFRRLHRGYDQAKLLAKAVAEENGLPCRSLLRRVRNTPPQSLKKDAAQRRANVLGAFQVTDPAQIRDKRILLLDDILTTGATASECARVLLSAGAKEVSFAAVAAASHDKKK